MASKYRIPLRGGEALLRMWDLGVGLGSGALLVGTRHGAVEALRVPTGGVVLHAVEEKGRVRECKTAGGSGEWARGRPMEPKP